MALKTGKDYVDSLKKMDPEIYGKGVRIKNFWEHPLLVSSVQAWGTQTYEAAFNSKLKDLLVVEGFDGEDLKSP